MELKAFFLVYPYLKHNFQGMYNDLQKYKTRTNKTERQKDRCVFKSLSILANMKFPDVLT